MLAYYLNRGLVKVFVLLNFPTEVIVSTSVYSCLIKLVPFCLFNSSKGTSTSIKVVTSLSAHALKDHITADQSLPFLLSNSTSLMTLTMSGQKNWYTMLLFGNGLVSHAMLLQQSPCLEPFLNGVGRHHPSIPQGTSRSSDSSVSKTPAFAALCLSDGSFAKIEVRYFCIQPIKQGVPIIFRVTAKTRVLAFGWQ